MATQQHALEILRKRVEAGERPAVDVAGKTYEFSGVQWVGVSPIVYLREPDRGMLSKTASAWKQEGAIFKARSRNLALASARPRAARLAKTPAELERDIQAIAAPGVASPVQLGTGEAAIVIAFTEDVQEIAPGQKTWRHDLGERPKLIQVTKPSAAMWVNRGNAADLEKARAYIQRAHPTTGRVFVYPVEEPDPLGRARRDVLR